MNKQEFTNIIGVISSVYPTLQVKSDRLAQNVWFGILKDYNAADVMQLAIEHIKTNKFAPVLAELIPKQAKEDEYGKVIEICAKYGSYRKAEALAVMTDAQRDAVKAIGYERICRSEPQELRAEFNRVYKPKGTELMLQ